MCSKIMNILTITTCMFLTFAILNAEEGEEYWSSYSENGYFFRVHHNRKFFLHYHYETIPVLTKSFASTGDMERLLISEVELEEIQPGAFNALPNLKSLEIIRNKIKKLEPGIFNGLNITQLEISWNSNPINIAPNTFDNMTSLQLIRLDNIQLSLWNSQWFFNTPSLTAIYANGNLLEEIPDNAFQNLNSDNQLTIFFYNNRIKKINKDAFRGIKKIKVLQLGNNKLKEFDGSVLQDIEIQELRIHVNQIRCLEEDNFDKIFIARDKTLIDNNPWEPNCLKTMLKWIKLYNKTTDL